MTIAQYWKLNSYGLSACLIVLADFLLDVDVGAHVRANWSYLSPSKSCPDVFGKRDITHDRKYKSQYGRASQVEMPPEAAPVLGFARRQDRFFLINRLSGFVTPR